MNFEFEKMSIETILSGKAGDGTRYLELFLQEYTRVFNEKVTPSCNKCISNYITKYQKYIMKGNNQNDCAFKLKAKYRGMQMEFGSDEIVTPETLTNEQALRLLSRNGGENYFDFIPDPLPKVEPSEDAPKKKGGRKKKSAEEIQVNEPEEVKTEE